MRTSLASTTIKSPLIRDYGHISDYEELWLLERAFGKSLSNRGLYDASLHPREERPSLNLAVTDGAAMAFTH